MLVQRAGVQGTLSSEITLIRLDQDTGSYMEGGYIADVALPRQGDFPSSPVVLSCTCTTISRLVISALYNV